MLLLSASVLRAHNEPLGWSLLSFKGAGKDGEVDVVGRRGGRVEEGRVGSRAQETVHPHRLSCVCSSPLSCVCATSVLARHACTESSLRGMGTRMGLDATASESRRVADYKG